MATIAVYNLKGGVGKTTLAVNIAAMAASVSRRRTLLWDLDPQGGATFILRGEADPKVPAKALFAKDAAIERLARKTQIAGLDLIAADASLRGLDRLFFEAAKKRRLAKLVEQASAGYERIVLDCPPGLSDTAEQVMRAADIIVVPVIPSELSHRAFRMVVDHLDRLPGGRGAVLPVHNMVDRRRAGHREALAAHPDWPIVPMASTLEASAGGRAPIGTFAPRSTGAAAIQRLWAGIERRIVTGR